MLDYAKKLPGIDATQIVVAGKSMGGWNTLVFGASNPPDLKGLLNFADGVKESDCSKPDDEGCRVYSVDGDVVWSAR